MKVLIQRDEKSNPEIDRSEVNAKKAIADILGTSNFVVISFPAKQAELLLADRNTEADMTVSDMSPKHLYYASRALMRVAQEHSPKGVLLEMLKDMKGMSDVRVSRGE